MSAVDKPKRGYRVEENTEGTHHHSIVLSPRIISWAKGAVDRKLGA